ncbi:MAG: YIP1 family protein [Usitatibacteraceae bacterium]
MSTSNRIKAMFIAPKAEWDAVAREMPGTGILLCRFLLPLGLLAPLATAVGRSVFDANWSAEYGYSMLSGSAVNNAIATFVFEIASVYLLAAVLYLLARTERQRPPFLAALQVAVLGSIPLLLSGAALVIPAGVVITILAGMYAFYLYYLGARRLFGIRESDSAVFIGVAMFCMVLLSSVLGAIASALGFV